MSDSSPRIFKHYQVLEKIGAGSAGDVFRAHDPNLDRVVAIKVLPQESVTIPEAVTRFLREARALAKCDHPNIVRVHDISYAPPQPFIVMEYVDGKPLRECIDKLTGTDAKLAVLQQIAEALGYAHKNGIIHRDLNPNNVIVRSDGLSKVIDFGWTKVVGGENLTQSNEGGLGTLYYISPEQQQSSKQVDYRTDIFSFGCIAYFIFAGKDPLPLAHLNAVDIRVRKHITKLFESCVQELPEDRPDSMTDVLEIIKAARISLDESSEKKTPKKSKIVRRSITLSNLKLEANWLPAAGGTGYYELSLRNPNKHRIENGTIKLSVPSGFAVEKLGIAGALHQEPSIQMPRISLGVPSEFDNRIRIGRLRFHDLIQRLTSPSLPVKWTVTGQNISPATDSTDIDLEALIPVRALPAVSSTRRLSFEKCATSDDVNCVQDPRLQKPRPQYDPLERRTVLYSSSAHNDSLSQLIFDPQVPISDADVLKLRIRVGSWEHFTLHFWITRTGKEDLCISLKPQLDQDQRLSPTEWVLSIKDLAGTDGWFDLVRPIRSDLQRLFDVKDPTAHISRIGIRGDYRLAHIDFAKEQRAETPPPPNEPASEPGQESFTNEESEEGWKPDRDKLLSRADVLKLLEDAKKNNYRLYIFYLCVLNAGLSVSEAGHLKCDDLIGNKLRVTRRRKQKPVVHMIQLDVKVSEILRSFIGDRSAGYIFTGAGSCRATRKSGKVDCDGGHIHMRTFQTQFRLSISRTGLAILGRGVHYLRHFAILLFLKTTNDLYATKQFAGHSSSGITEIYLQVLRSLSPEFLGEGPVY